MNELFSLALTDRANQVSLQADQVKSGASDTTCTINAGGDNYFEFAMQTSSSSYSSALSAGGFKTASDFQNGLVKSFLANLSALYPNQISNVTFVSQKTITNGGYALTFRIYFNSKITVDSKRTEIATRIQGAYYQVLTKYFKSVAQSMKIPTSVSIAVPAAVSTVMKKAVVTSSKDSSKSVLSGSLVNLTQVSSSSSKYHKWTFLGSVC